MLYDKFRGSFDNSKYGGAMQYGRSCDSSYVVRCSSKKESGTSRFEDSFLMVQAKTSIQLSSKEYVSHIVTLPTAAVAALTDSSIVSMPLSLDVGQDKLSRLSPARNEVVMAGLAALPSTPMAISSCDTKGHLTIWDLRSKRQETQLHALDTNLSVTAMGVSNYGEIALGTEAGPDAEIHIYDVRQIKATKPLVKYVDSHNDDITDLQFHPSQRNRMVSGSTDGVVNLFDISIHDEDEAIIEAFNHQASVHRTGFFTDTHEAVRRLKVSDNLPETKDRVFTLSHMETLTIYPIDGEPELREEDKPVEFGDVRDAWKCQYVADYQKQHFLIGSNDEGWARLVPIVDASPQEAVTLEGGHGTEVVRSFDLWQPAGTCFTGGEDGCVKLWDISGQFDETKQVSELLDKNKSDAAAPVKTGKAEKSGLKRSDPYSKDRSKRKHKS